MSLRLDWCSHEAAKYAVEHWHYSKTMPVSKAVFIGVWENEKYIGCVIYSWGANPNMAKAYSLQMTECAELVRVALTNHIAPVSKIVSLSIKMIRKQSPGLRLLVSYADKRMGHIGAIYQAMNWIYTGETSPKKDLMLGDRLLQRRSYTGKNFGGGRLRPPQGAEWVDSPPKHRYLYPLDDAMRKQIEPLRKPYPKRGSGEIDSAAETNPQTGGASPTDPLLELPLDGEATP